MIFVSREGQKRFRQTLCNTIYYNKIDFYSKAKFQALSENNKNYINLNYRARGGHNPHECLNNFAPDK